jgi:hypothetical protein
MMRLVRVFFFFVPISTVWVVCSHKLFMCKTSRLHATLYTKTKMSQRASNYLGIGLGLGLVLYAMQSPRGHASHNFGTRYHMWAHKMGLVSNMKSGVFRTEVYEKEKILTTFESVGGLMCEECGYISHGVTVDDNCPTRTVKYCWTQK